MTCYNLTRIQPTTQLYRTLDDLCVWKPANHRSADGFEMCISCSGYEENKDCYFPHVMMDKYLIDEKKVSQND